MKNEQPDFERLERNVAMNHECAGAWVTACDPVVYRVLDKRVAVAIRFLCEDHLMAMAVVKERRAMKLE